MNGYDTKENSKLWDCHEKFEIHVYTQDIALKLYKVMIQVQHLNDVFKRKPQQLFQCFPLPFESLYFPCFTPIQQLPKDSDVATMYDNRNIKS